MLLLCLPMDRDHNAAQNGLQRAAAVLRVSVGLPTSMKRETKTKQQRLRTRRTTISYRCLKLLTIPMPLGLGS